VGVGAAVSFRILHCIIRKATALTRQCRARRAGNGAWKGLTGAVVDLQPLSSHGVSFHSYSEPHLSTDNELVRDVLLAVLASLAKLKREKISQRTKAGLERARAKGKRLGRALFSPADREKLRLALDTGLSWHAVMRGTGIRYSTVKKHARLLGYAPRNRTRRMRAAELPHG